MIRASHIASLALPFLFLVACASCNQARDDKEGQVPTASITIQNSNGELLTVQAEVVSTPEKRQKGLMYRKHLPEGEGMLFVFESEEPRDFWMRNTFISLDMLFLDRTGKIVGIVHDAQPEKEKRLGVDEPSMYVLEVPGGWCRTHNVHRGLSATFKL